ncbi:hypothetical protein BJX96DRAFT_127334 [Aspergillus floccosus]
MSLPALTRTASSELIADATRGRLQCGQVHGFCSRHDFDLEYHGDMIDETSKMPELMTRYFGSIYVGFLWFHRQCPVELVVKQQSRAHRAGKSSSSASISASQIDSRHVDDLRFLACIGICNASKAIGGQGSVCSKRTQRPREDSNRPDGRRWD